MASNAIRLACIFHCRLCTEMIQQWCAADADFDLAYATDKVVGDWSECLKSKPDVLLLDLDMEGGLLPQFQQLCQLADLPQIALVATRWSDLALATAVDSNVAGILLKSEAMADLFLNLRAIARGEQRISPALLPRLRFDPKNCRFVLASGSPVSSLNNLQLEILRLLACGDSLKMIAGKMQLSRKSIDGHKYRLMRKLRIKDRVLLSRLAIREGLIQP